MHKKILLLTACFAIYGVSSVENPLNEEKISNEQSAEQNAPRDLDKYIKDLEDLCNKINKSAEISPSSSKKLNIPFELWESMEKLVQEGKSLENSKKSEQKPKAE